MVKHNQKDDSSRVSNQEKKVINKLSIYDSGKRIDIQLLRFCTYSVG